VVLVAASSIEDEEGVGREFASANMARDGRKYSPHTAWQPLYRQPRLYRYSLAADTAVVQGMRTWLASVEMLAQWCRHLMGHSMRRSQTAKKLLPEVPMTLGLDIKEHLCTGSYCAHLIVNIRLWSRMSMLLFILLLVELDETRLAFDREFRAIQHLEMFFHVMGKLICSAAGAAHRWYRHRSWERWWQ